MAVGPGGIERHTVTLNHQAVQKVASMAFSTDARNAFGEEGEACLRVLLNSVRAFFQAVPPDGLPTTFVFVYRVPGHGVDEVEEGMERFATSLGLVDLPGYRRLMEDASVIVIDVRGDGRYDLAATTTTPSLEPLSERSLVFVNEEGAERFVIGGRSRTMPQLATGGRSNFAVRTVADLDDALERYRREAAEVSCPILAEVWEGGRDGPRLVFRNRPEAAMRRSLERFLTTAMSGDVSVRPEHNTDETRPVDLVVDWFGVKLRALIEIKWMGQSLTRDSDGTQFTTYGNARAQDGADQLVDYLDRERSTDPDVGLRGYLAVFDGRRRNIIDPSTPIAANDACHFRNRHVVLKRNYASERRDIAPLIRYFLEPRASLLAPPV